MMLARGFCDNDGVSDNDDFDDDSQIYCHVSSWPLCLLLAAVCEACSAIARA